MKVTVYTTDNCAYCPMVKNLLKYKKVEFDEVNVTNDPDLAAQAARLSGATSVPITHIEREGESKVVIGFQPHLLIPAIS